MPAYNPRSNNYYRTLVDPFECYGEKIPDQSTDYTSPFSVVFRLTLAAFVAGPGSLEYYSGFALNSLRPDDCLYSISYNSITGAVTYAPYDAGGPAPGDLPKFKSLVELYQSCRLVSAGVGIASSASSLNDQGAITAVPIPAKGSYPGDSTSPYNMSGDPDYATISKLQSAVKSFKAPVKEGPVTMRYCPMGSAGQTYTQYPGTTVTAVNLPWYGGFVFLCTGLAQTSTFELTIRLNYEGIPRSNSVDLVNPKISKMDTIRFEHALNEMAEQPLVINGAAAQKEVHQSGTAGGESGTYHRVEPTHPQGKSGFMGFLDHVWKSTKKILPEAAKVVEELI
jgi:hypothetical protein